MNKYQDNNLVEVMDSIILLNDNYKSQNLKEGYVGVVVDNLIHSQGIILVDFFNPFTGEDIKTFAEINRQDFRVLSNSPEDQKLVKSFKDLFIKN